MNKKTVSISLPKIEGVELKNATVDLEKGVVVVEYGQEDTEKDISEIAPDFESAISYLCEGLHRSLFYTTKKHMAKLEAFNELLILAEAWNYFDEFEPDWGGLEQKGHYPLFRPDGGMMAFSHTSTSRVSLDPYTSNLSFKSAERAKQFATTFINLFRIVLTN